MSGNGDDPPALFVQLNQACVVEGSDVRRGLTGNEAVGGYGRHARDWSPSALFVPSATSTFVNSRRVYSIVTSG